MAFESMTIVVCHNQACWRQILNLNREHMMARTTIHLIHKAISNQISFIKITDTRQLFARRLKHMLYEYQMCHCAMITIKNHDLPYFSFLFFLSCYYWLPAYHSHNIIYFGCGLLVFWLVSNYRNQFYIVTTLYKTKANIFMQTNEEKNCHQ